MAEQKDTINKGVPMSNGIGGTLETGSSSGSGGGASSGNTNTGSAGTAGNSSSSPSAVPGSNTPQIDNADYLKNAIENYLGVSALGYTFDSIVELYVNKKLGFDTIEKEYLENNKDLDEADKQKVKDTIKAEKEAAIKLFKEGAGKDELKKKFEEFKAASFDLGKSLTSIPTEFVKAISESVMPNVIGPVAPNPFSSILKAYNGISRIKKVIDTAFISLQTLLNVSDSLGVSQTEGFNNLLNPIVNGLKTLDGTIQALKKKEAEQESDLELQAKIEEAKKNWSYPHGNGKVMNAEQVEELARGKDINMFQFPLTEGNRKDLRKFVKKGEDSSSSFRRRRGQDAEIILKYDDWTRWFAKQLNAKNDSGAKATTSSGNGSNDAVYSGSTRL